MTIERVAARKVEEFLIVAGVPTSINVKICFQFLIGSYLYIESTKDVVSFLFFLSNFKVEF